MKKLFTFLFLLTVYLSSAMATTVTTRVIDGKTFVVVSDISDQSNISDWGLSTDQQSLITGAANLKLEGTVTTNALTALNSCRPTTLDLSDALIPMTATLGNVKENLVTLIMPTSPDYYSVPSQFCNNDNPPSTISTIVFSSNIKIINSSAFDNLPALTHLTLPEGLEYIGSGAFNKSSLTSIEIPGTVTYIGESAFSIATAEKVIFKELSQSYINNHKVPGSNPALLNRIKIVNGSPVYEDNNPVYEQQEAKVNMHIATNAFQNAKSVWDVYVETEGTIICANEAFSLDVTNGHADPSRRLSTLHYPSDKAEEYVNQKHALTAAIASDPAQFHDWLVAHLTKAQQETNGWYEFVNAGPSPDPDEQPTGEKFLKTWSEYGVQKKGNYVNGELTENENGETVYYLARLVPDGVRAYIVHAVTPSGTDAYTITLKRVRVIPPNTGVILYGQSNSKTKEGLATLVMSQVPYIGYPMSREYWNLNEKDGEGKIINKNYLIGTGNSSVHVYPYEPYNNPGAAVTFRNFFLIAFTATDTYRKNKQTAGWASSNADYVGFFRAKSSNLAAGKAYLHLAADEFNLAEGNECIVLKDEQFNLEYSDTQKGVLITKKIPGTDPAQYYWDGRSWNDPLDGHDWGNRNSVNGIDDYLVSFRGEFENDVDGLVTLTIPTEVVNEYYTLQGVKVTNPTKSGIYIKNGKKVVVK